jgi:competence protein ComFB
MDLHNTNEDIIIAEVTEIFDSLEKNGNPDNICTCDQCRMDTMCYVLNRIEPHYIVSNRGAVRVERETIANQQRQADIVTMIREGIDKINENKRPSSKHSTRRGNITMENKPVFNLPTIIGRIFNGMNFEPISNIKVELLRNDDLVTMVDDNWQNPYHLLSHSEGTFSFWPAPILAENVNVHRNFEFFLRINAPNFDELKHFFKIPVVSEVKSITAFSRERTFKLADIYLFPPGEEEEENCF